MESFKLPDTFLPYRSDPTPEASQFDVYQTVHYKSDGTSWAVGASQQGGLYVYNLQCPNRPVTALQEGVLYGWKPLQVVEHDGQPYLLTESTGHRIAQWDLRSFKVVALGQGHMDEITAIRSLSVDDQTCVVSSSRDGQICIWKPKPSELRCTSTIATKSSPN